MLVVRWTSDQAVQVLDLNKVIVSCPWARNLLSLCLSSRTEMTKVGKVSMN